MPELHPMYAPSPNSPTTELSAAIDATQETIPIQSAGAVPDAPNLITLGTDEAAETVLYTGKSGNTLTGCTRGYDGTTAKSWPSGTRAARLMTAQDLAAVQDNVRAIAANQKETAAITRTLSQGLTLVDSDQPSPARVVVLGQTRYNLPGSDGGCESVAPFSASGPGTTELSATQKRSGNNSIKFTTTSQIRYFFKDYAHPLDATKYYIAAVWVYIESFTSGTTFELSLRDIGTMTGRYSAFANPAIVGSWQLVTIKIPAPNTLVGSGFRLLFGHSTLGTSVSYYDEIRIIEVTPAEYAAIGDTINGEDVDRLIPYIDGMQSVRGLAVTVKGRNIAKGTPDTIHANATLNGPYDVSATTTATYAEIARMRVPIIAGQQYALTVNRSGGGRAVGYWRNAAGAGIGNSWVWANGTSYTAPTGAAAVDIVFDNASAAGTYTFRDWMLVLGDTSALPPSFVPQQDQTHLADVTLPSLPNGVRDIYYADKGEVWRALGETRLSDLAFNGVITSGTNVDRIRYQRPSDMVTGNTAGLMVAEGFMESPSAWDAVANVGSFNTTATTALIDFIVAKGTTRQQFEASVNMDSRILYRLAAPDWEPVPHNGALTAHPGSNIVEIRTGAILREEVGTALISGSYYINTNAASRLSKRADVILDISGGNDSHLWSKQRRGTPEADYGYGFGRILAADYDATKDKRYVSYIVLDRHAYTTAVSEASVTFAANLGSVVGWLTEQQARIMAHLDKIDWEQLIDEAHIENLRFDRDRHEGQISELETEMDAVETGLSTHTGRTDNPHGVTKDQVGLGSVQNYGVATQAQAEAGAASNVYMTPQRTKQAIDTRLLNNVSLRINDGKLEYNDGTGWQAVASGNDYEPYSATTQVTTTTVTTWYTAFEITGEGEIHQIFGQLFSFGGNTPQHHIRITVDGVVKSLLTFASSAVITGLFMSDQLAHTRLSDTTLALQLKGTNLSISPDWVNWGAVGDVTSPHFGHVRLTYPIRFKTSCKVDVYRLNTTNSQSSVTRIGINGGVK